MALRIAVDESTSHDLLMTNFPVSHARDARQFVEFARATAGGTVSRLLGVLGLVRRFGLRETVRMLRNVSTARRHVPDSVATETYWSRGALTWGPTLAVRYLLRPAPGTRRTKPSGTDPNYLTTEAAKRLRAGDVRMELCIQRYRDPTVDTHRGHQRGVDASRSRRPNRSRSLTIPQGDVTTPDAQTRWAARRRTGLQPVEHHRRLPPAGEPEPGPQGGLRRQRGGPRRRPGGTPRSRGATWCSAPGRGRCSRW